MVKIEKIFFKMKLHHNIIEILGPFTGKFNQLKELLIEKYSKSSFISFNTKKIRRISESVVRIK